MIPMFAVLFATAMHLAPPTPSRALLVLEKAQNTLVILDPVTLTIVARIPAGNDPHEVAVSSDGRVAYVSNYHAANGEGGSQITVIDLVAQKPLTPIDLGGLRAPHGLDFAAGKLWFSVEDSKAVGRYDPVARRVDWVTGTGQERTHMVVVSRDGKRVFSTNVNSPSVSIIEPPLARPTGVRPPPGGVGARPPAPAGPPSAGLPPAGPPAGGNRPTAEWQLTNIAVGRGAEGLDLTPDGRELWVANAQDHTISVIDVATKAVVATLASTTSANRLKITPDGRFAFVSDLGGNEMLVINIRTRAAHTRIAMGGNSEGIVMTPDGQHAYTTLNSRDAVARIDLRTMTVTGEVKTGRGPDGLAWVVRR